MEPQIFVRDWPDGIVPWTHVAVAGEYVRLLVSWSVASGRCLPFVFSPSSISEPVPVPTAPAGPIAAKTYVILAFVALGAVEVQIVLDVLDAAPLTSHSRLDERR